MAIGNLAIALRVIGLVGMCFAWHGIALAADNWPDRSHAQWFNNIDASEPRAIIMAPPSLPGVYIAVSCNLLNEEQPILMAGIIAGEDRAGFRRSLPKMSPASAGVLTVTVTSENGSEAFLTGAASYGDYLIGGIDGEMAFEIGGAITPSQVRMLKEGAQLVIKAGPNYFPVTLYGSAAAIGSLPCGGGHLSAISRTSSKETYRVVNDLEIWTFSGEFAEPFFVPGEQPSLIANIYNLPQNSEAAFQLELQCVDNRARIRFINGGVGQGLTSADEKRTFAFMRSIVNGQNSVVTYENNKQTAIVPANIDKKTSLGHPLSAEHLMAIWRHDRLVITGGQIDIEIGRSSEFSKSFQLWINTCNPNK